MGIQYWQPGASIDAPQLQVSRRGKAGQDSVISLSVTHDIANAVAQYCDHALGAEYQFIDARLAGGPSGVGIVDGGHAWQVAEALAAALRTTAQATEGTVHFFSAAPNGLVFFFAQQLGLGQVTTYEFDFERKRGGGYQAAWRIDEL